METNLPELQQLSVSHPNHHLAVKTPLGDGVEQPTKNPGRQAHDGDVQKLKVAPSDGPNRPTFAVLADHRAAVIEEKTQKIFLLQAVFRNRMTDDRRGLIPKPFACAKNTASKFRVFAANFRAWARPQVDPEASVFLEDLLSKSHVCAIGWFRKFKAFGPQVEECQNSRDGVRALQGHPRRRPERGGRK